VGPPSSRTTPRGWPALHDEQVQILVVAQANPDEGRHKHRRCRKVPDRAHLGRHPPGILRFPSTARAEGDPRDADLPSQAGKLSRRVSTFGRHFHEKPKKKGDGFALSSPLLTSDDRRRSDSEAAVVFHRSAGVSARSLPGRDPGGLVGRRPRGSSLKRKRGERSDD